MAYSRRSRPMDDTLDLLNSSSSQYVDNTTTDLSGMAANNDGTVIGRLSKTVGHLQEEIKIRDSEKMLLEEAVMLMEQNIKTHSNNADFLESKLLDSKLKADRLYDENLKLCDDIKRYEEDADNATKEKSEMEIEKNQTIDELKKMKQLYERLSQSTKDQNAETKQAKEDALKMENKLVLAEKELDQKINDVHYCEEQINHLESELSDSKMKHQDAMKQIEKLTVSICELQRSFKNTNEIRSQELNTVKSDATARRSECDRLMEEFEREKGKVKKQNADLQKLHKENMGLTEKLEERAKTICSLRSELKDAKSAISGLNKKETENVEKHDLETIALNGKLRDAEHMLEETKMKLSLALTEVESAKKNNSKMNDKIESLETALRSKAANNSELSDNLTSKDGAIRRLDMDVNRLKQKCDALSKQLEDKENTISSLQTEKDLKDKIIEEKKDEANKLNACLQNNTQTHDNEVQARDDAINHYKRSQKTLDDTISNLQAKVDQLERSRGQLQVQYSTAMREVDARDVKLDQLGRQLDANKILLDESEQELAQSKQNAMKAESEAIKLKDELEDIQHSSKSMQESTAGLKTELSTLKSQQKDLLKRLSSRDDMLHKVTVEATRLKEKYSLATAQRGQTTDMIKYLEDELARMKVDLDEAHHANDRIQYELEQNILKVKSEADEKNSQAQNFSEKLSRSESDANRFRADADKLNEKLQGQIKELQELRGYKHGTELKLTVLEEKYRTVQDEVGKKNQTLLELKTQLNDLQEQLSSTNEEVEMKNQTISRLKNNNKKLDSELDECNANLEKHIQMRKQDLTNHDKTKKLLTQCEKDLMLANQSHDKLKNDSGDKYNSLNAMLNNTKAELVKTQFELENLQLEYNKAQVNNEHCQQELKNKLEELNQSGLSKDFLKEQLAQQKIDFQQKCSEISSLQKDNAICAEELRTVKAECHDMAHNLNLTLQKYEESLSQLNACKHDLEVSSEKLAGFNDELKEKDDLIDNVSAQLTSAQEEVEELKQQVGTCEDVIENLTVELQRSQDDGKVNKRRVGSMRDENDVLARKLAEKQQELLELNDVIFKYKEDYQTFKNNHTYTNDEVLDNEKKLSSLEKHLDDVQKTITDQEFEIETVKQALARCKTQLSEEEETCVNKNNEIRALMQELEKARNQIDDFDRKLSYKVEQEGVKHSTIANQLDHERKSNDGLREEIRRRDDLLGKMKEDLVSSHKTIADKTQELDDVRSTADLLQVELEKAVRASADTESKKVDLCNDMEKLSDEMEETRNSYRKTAQDLAHFEEKSHLLEQNLNAVQDELNRKISILAKCEKSNKSYLSELKNCKETIEDLENDLRRQTESNRTLKLKLTECEQEMSTVEDEKRDLSKECDATKNDLKIAESSTKNLQEKVNDANAKVSSLENDLISERNQNKALKGEIADLNRTLGSSKLSDQELQKEITYLNSQLSECKSTIENLRHDVYEANAQNSTLRDDTDSLKAKLEYQVKHYENVESALQLKKQEIEKYEQSFATLQTELAASQAEYKECHKRMLDAMKTINDMDMKFSTMEKYKDDSTSQLSQSNRENLNLKNDLQNALHENLTLSQDIEVYEEKYRRVKSEMKTVQENNDLLCEDLAHYQMKLDQLSAEYTLLTDKNRIGLSELSKREERLGVTQTDLKTLQSKYRELKDKSRHDKHTIATLEQKYGAANQKIEHLQLELEQVCADSNKLQMESKSVVDNVNDWVIEQKQKNDKLNGTLHEKAAALDAVTTDRDQLKASKSVLEKEIARLRGLEEDFKHNKQQNEGFQKHCSEQQSLILQLREKISTMERDQDTIVTEKDATLDELHRRITDNIECIQTLNNQLNKLSKENIRQHTLVEQEVNARKRLEFELELKEQTNTSLRAQLEKSSLYTSRNPLHSVNS